WRVTPQTLFLDSTDSTIPPSFFPNRNEHHYQQQRQQQSMAAETTRMEDLDMENNLSMALSLSSSSSPYMCSNINNFSFSNLPPIFPNPNSKSKPSKSSKMVEIQGYIYEEWTDPTVIDPATKLFGFGFYQSMMPLDN